MTQLLYRLIYRPMLRQLLVSGLLTITTLNLSPVAAMASTDKLQTRNHSVAAEIGYLKETQNQLLTDLKITITRNNKRVVQKMQLPYKQLPNYDPEYDKKFYGISEDVKVVDLDGNGEPEVVVDIQTPGTHCCSATFIYSYNPEKRNYNVMSHFWGNYTSGYNLSEVSGKNDDRNLLDLNGDGILEFLARDDRFRGEFSAYGASFAPVQVWSFQNGKLIDVTERFPKLISQNVDDLWAMYRKVRLEAGPEPAKGAMAAYIGAKYLIGQGRDGIKRLSTQYPDKKGKNFTNELRVFLQKTGYLR